VVLSDAESIVSTGDVSTAAVVALTESDALAASDASNVITGSVALTEQDVFAASDGGLPPERFGGTGGIFPNQSRGETQAQKRARRIAQGIIKAAQKPAEADETLPSYADALRKIIDRARSESEQHKATLETLRAQRAVALERQIIADRKQAERELARVNHLMAVAAESIRQAQDAMDEFDMLFVASVLMEV
jgi:hypothetical protein